MQVLALVAYLVEFLDVQQTFLIAAPTAVVSNWAQELSKWTPSIPFLLHQGPADARADAFYQTVRQLSLYPLQSVFGEGPQGGEASQIRNLATQSFPHS